MKDVRKSPFDIMITLVSIWYQLSVNEDMIMKIIILKDNDKLCFSKLLKLLTVLGLSEICHK